MTTKPTGGPAFPGETVVKNGMHGTKRVNNSGMTLRDYFAGQALAGVAADGAARSDSSPLIAEWCYQIADAMLKERDK